MRQHVSESHPASVGQPDEARLEMWLPRHRINPSLQRSRIPAGTRPDCAINYSQVFSCPCRNVRVAWTSPSGAAARLVDGSESMWIVGGLEAIVGGPQRACLLLGPSPSRLRRVDAILGLRFRLRQFDAIRLPRYLPRALPVPSRPFAPESRISRRATPPVQLQRSPTRRRAASRSRAGNSARCTPTASASRATTSKLTTTSTSSLKTTTRTRRSEKPGRHLQRFRGRRGL